MFNKLVHATEGDAIFFNPLGRTNDFYALIEKILGVLVQIGLPILVLFIVYAGFKFVTARGNEAEVTWGNVSYGKVMIKNVDIDPVQIW